MGKPALVWQPFGLQLHHLMGQEVATWPTKAYAMSREGRARPSQKHAKNSYT